MVGLQVEQGSYTDEVELEVGGQHAVRARRRKPRARGRAHAHGTLLGILLLVYASLAERFVVVERRAVLARDLRIGAVLMPLGFFLGGVLNSEGDPSLGILLVPLGALFLLSALVRAALAVQAG